MCCLAFTCNLYAAVSQETARIAAEQAQRDAAAAAAAAEAQRVEQEAARKAAAAAAAERQRREIEAAAAAAAAAVAPKYPRWYCITVFMFLVLQRSLECVWKSCLRPFESPTYRAAMQNFYRKFNPTKTANDVRCHF